MENTGFSFIFFISLSLYSLLTCSYKNHHFIESDYWNWWCVVSMTMLIAAGGGGDLVLQFGQRWLYHAIIGCPKKNIDSYNFSLSLSLPFSDFFFFQLSISSQWNMNFDLISMKHALHWKFISNYPNLQRIDSFLADLYGFCIIRFRFNFPIKTISKCRLHEKLTRSKNHLTA